jgi:hypothetical protein
MKFFLPIIAIISLSFGCAPPKKASGTNSTTNLPQKKEKPIVHQQFAPGTCSLLIKNSSVKTIDDAYWLIGLVESVKGYGAGFNYAISKQSKIKISLNKNQFELLKGTEKVDCIITHIQKMNGSAFLKLEELN